MDETEIHDLADDADYAAASQQVSNTTYREKILSIGALPFFNIKFELIRLVIVVCNWIKLQAHNAKVCLHLVLGRV